MISVHPCDHHLPTMQRRDEHDLVTTLEHIPALAFQLPIRIVDEDENTRSTVSGARQPP